MRNVSVVIPTFNRATLLRRALNSVFEQSFPPNEVIVVDDASTDDTHRIIHDYPVIYLKNEKNLGVSCSRNKGIEAAKGSWIALLDSDDEWKKNKLRVQIESIDSTQEKYSLYHCDEIWLKNNEFLNQSKKHKKSGGNIFLNCLQLCLISPSAVLFKKEVFSQLGGFDESMRVCEDYDLWLRWTLNYEVFYDEKKMVIKHGGHSDQLSHANWGMDRFRIYSLLKIKTQKENVLSEQELLHLNKVLREKLNILIKGARKRNNFDLIDKLVKTYELNFSDPSSVSPPTHGSGGDQLMGYLLDS